MGGGAAAFITAGTLGAFCYLLFLSAKRKKEEARRLYGIDNGGGSALVADPASSNTPDVLTRARHEPGMVARSFTKTFQSLTRY